jgi:hypothetical protein
MKRRAWNLAGGTAFASAVLIMLTQVAVAQDQTDRKILKDAVHKIKDGHRPPGWDKGEKVGWKGGSEPPGFQKGKKKGWDN